MLLPLLTSPPLSWFRARKEFIGRFSEARWARLSAIAPRGQPAGIAGTVSVSVRSHVGAEAEGAPLLPAGQLYVVVPTAGTVAAAETHIGLAAVGDPVVSVGQLKVVVEMAGIEVVVVREQLGFAEFGAPVEPAGQL